MYQDALLDWPQLEDSDLCLHDGYHPSSDVENWHFNAYMTTEEGAPFSIYVCFLMLKMPDNKEQYAFSAIWTFCDLNNKKYYTASYIDQQMPEIFSTKLKNYHPQDLSLKIALEEALEHGNDDMFHTMLTQEDTISNYPFGLSFGDLRLEKSSNGLYLLRLENTKDNLRCELIFDPKTAPARQWGKEGNKGLNNEQMFGYFSPRCLVQGELCLQNQTFDIKTGQGWYEHQFGFMPETTKPQNLSIKSGWTRVSIQLANHCNISLYGLYDPMTQTIKEITGTAVFPAGNQISYKDITMRVISTWKSLQSFCNYGTAWKLQIPALSLDLNITALFEGQECLSLLFYPGFWEGYCDVNGLLEGQDITGMAFIQQTMLNSMESIDDFFASVSESVSEDLDSILPMDPDHQQMLRLIAPQKNLHFLEGIDQKQFIKTLITPIRTITDRGAKRWRSFAFLACYHIVGGEDNRSVRGFLAAPELIHTGSLIIDDIQDNSLLRRGGASCHHVFGQPIAINAGTYAYGLWDKAFDQTEIAAIDRCNIYEIYFEMFRAAHVGQAMDIDGHFDLMSECIETNDYKKLQLRVLATHRLKSAVPAVALARIGAILGKASDSQIDILSDFFEALGLAFQIMDDVINLRGHQNSLKSPAEDLITGKITYPIAKSLEFLTTEELRWVLTLLTEKSTDRAKHQRLIDMFESSGTMQACCVEARSLVDKSWARLDAAFKGSHTKILLRAFSFYLINRH